MNKQITQFGIEVGHSNTFAQWIIDTKLHLSEVLLISILQEQYKVTDL